MSRRNCDDSSRHELTSLTHRQTDRQTDRPSNTHTDRLTHSQANTDRLTVMTTVWSTGVYQPLSNQPSPPRETFWDGRHWIMTSLDVLCWSLISVTLKIDRVLLTSSSISMTAFSALWPMNLLRSRNLALGDNGWRSGWTQNASDSVATPECSRGGTGRLCRRRIGLRGFSMKERDMQFTVRRSLHTGMHGSHLTDHHPRSYGVHLTPWWG